MNWLQLRICIKWCQGVSVTKLIPLSRPQDLKYGILLVLYEICPAFTLASCGGDGVSVCFEKNCQHDSPNILFSHEFICLLQDSFRSSLCRQHFVHFSTRPFRYSSAAGASYCQSFWTQTPILCIVMGYLFSNMKKLHILEPFTPHKLH